MSDLNIRLAKWAGYTYDEKRPSDIRWEWPNGNLRDYVPYFNESIDLIRRDLLGKLSDEQWERLDTLLEHQWESVLASVPHPDYSWARFILTLPPADLAAAIAEVIHD